MDRLGSFREPWGSLGKPWWTVWAHFGSLGGHSGGLGGPFGLILRALGVIGKALVDHLGSFWGAWGSFGRPWWAIWAYFGSFVGHFLFLRDNCSSFGPKIVSITKTLFFLCFFNDFEGMGSRF